MPSNRKYYTSVEWEELICRCKASGLSDWRWCRENNISTSSFYRQLKKFRNTSVAPITERPLSDPSAFPEIQEVVPLTVRDETPVIPEPRQDSPAVRLTVRGLSSISITMPAAMSYETSSGRQAPYVRRDIRGGKNLLRDRIMFRIFLSSYFLKMSELPASMSQSMRIKI